MTTITYVKSTGSSSASTAKSRRHDRRKHEAIQRELIESQINRAFGLKMERQPMLSRAEIACKRKPESRAVIATIGGLSSERHYPSATQGACLPDVANYAAGHRKVADSITAR